MAKSDYDKIGKFFWPVILLTLSIGIFIYCLHESPGSILTAIVPIGLYILIVKAQKKQQREVHYYPRTYADFLITMFSFFIVVVMFTWYIEGYYYIETAFFIVLFLVSIFTGVSFINHLWRNL